MAEPAVAPAALALHLSSTQTCVCAYTRITTHTEIDRRRQDVPVSSHRLTCWAADVFSVPLCVSPAFFYPFCIHSAVINKLLFSVFACLFVLYPTTVVAFIALLCLDPLIHSKWEMSETVCGAVLHDLMCLHACSPQCSMILISKRC